MRLTRPESLGKAVEVTATNRPVKIAYLVPFNDQLHSHLILDAVFFESYTRWAGVYTLVIPITEVDFPIEGYDQWLKYFDPDFVYSYVDLADSLVEKIERLGCPMVFLKHKLRTPTDAEVSWRSFLPDLGHYIQPVSSLSTLQIPTSHLHGPFAQRQFEPMVLTQYGTEPIHRFLADNFGTGFNVQNVTHAIPGLFKTLCLVPDGLSERVIAGTERCVSVFEAFQALIERKAIPISSLAALASSGAPRPESRRWVSAFRIFVGRTPLDRVHFWNSRHLGSNWHDSSNAIIVTPELFDSDDFLKQFGDYLNKNNFLGPGNGPYVATLHSHSIDASTLREIGEKVGKNTWSRVYVSDEYNFPAVPTADELLRMHSKSTDSVAFKLTEDTNTIKAVEPAHFIYTPPHFRGINQGQWIVELTIERHNNHSRYSNVIDTWELPRRKNISRAFTDRLAKPTIKGTLALVPSNQNSFFRRESHVPRTYEIRFPSDEDFFRYLVLKDLNLGASEDLRMKIPQCGYADLEISDKGENLRGVIALFDHLHIAYEILTKKFWRMVLMQAKDDAMTPLTFRLDQLKSLIPNDRQAKERVAKKFHLDNIRVTKDYLQASLMDALEYLVRKNIFYQVAHWRCIYCGNVNSRSFDNMKIRNQCDICTTEYFSPIDIDWKYEINGFVYRSLEKHSGLSVLWALGYLQEQTHSGAFWYIPEVNLFEKDDDAQNSNEIDILCIANGSFHAVEAKRSASTFLNKEGSVDKFLKVIEQLRPDVAVLAFERYGIEGEDLNSIRDKLNSLVTDIRNQLAPWTILKVFVGVDIPDFDDICGDFGWQGRRVFEYY